MGAERKAAVAAARRRELGAFLRARRERTSPAEVGLPGSARRRTPGLRREELAVLAGVSTTWYAYLEQGRDVRPSDQVLAAIADTLRLAGDERAHLRALADGAAGRQHAVTREAPPPSPVETVAPEVAAVLALVAPAPAYVTGATTDVLVWNDPAAELFPGLALRRDTERPNLARWVFLDPDARHVLVDWEAVAQSVLARLRTNAGRHPGDERFARLAEELRAGSAEADAWWPRYDIATHRTGTKRVRHPSRGELTLGHAAFTVADAPEQVLVVYSRN
ncbi:helix-turn-helix transcriptional regulator [Streptomyces sp. NPDC004296]|uniref:helix-turn-helix transcriptional regulator n=1 Tax=Streptomyces sp. NPDC004296 TaxID=3364697 RepID=UPI0036A7DDB6